MWTKKKEVKRNYPELFVKDLGECMQEPWDIKGKLYPIYFVTSTIKVSCTRYGLHFVFDILYWSGSLVLPLSFWFWSKYMAYSQKLQKLVFFVHVVLAFNYYLILSWGTEGYPCFQLTAAYMQRSPCPLLYVFTDKHISCAEESCFWQADYTKA
jgi:hypothetical protein